LRFDNKILKMNTARKIDLLSSVSDIVNNDYRTAEVFRKYGIEYCCGGKWPLQMILESNDLDAAAIIEELELSIHPVGIRHALPFEKWDIDFLIDYIVNIHHTYLKKALPETKEQLEKFAEGHQKKYPELTELVLVFKSLILEMLPHLQHEEEIIFPYIRQIAHAFHNKESYASLLVRTLRKPVENVMNHEHESVNKILTQMRQLTNSYTPPPNSCVNHRVNFLKLLEIDTDLVQHMHLENAVLFPRSIEMEKKLLFL
jgi:regulator of cell morphogenesis and NO signaling